MPDKSRFRVVESDPGEDATAAALREAWEELGLDPNEVEIVGELVPIGPSRAIW